MLLAIKAYKNRTVALLCVLILVGSERAIGGDEVHLSAAPPSEAAAPASPGLTDAQIRALMRPSFQLDTAWYETVDAIGLSRYGFKVSLPTYPVFGPPPPIVSVGYGLTRIDAASVPRLPNELHSVTAGLSWMRRWNARWMVRSMVGVAFATDGNNESSDAWQFRGGLFGLYQPHAAWTWTFGVIALGRNDIPVVPAVGLVYQPHPRLCYDFMFPRPRVSWLFSEAGQRQQWIYLGGGLNGGTWAYRSPGGVDDQITYRDWQIVLGWESTPRREPGMPFAIGRKMNAEVGYAFGRDFEFESGFPDRAVSDAFVFQGGIRF